MEKNRSGIKYRHREDFWICPHCGRIFTTGPNGDCPYCRSPVVDVLQRETVPLWARPGRRHRATRTARARV